MTLKFINKMNELIADSYLEMSDEEIRLLIHSPNGPAEHEISSIKNILDQQVKVSRAKQLASARKQFEDHRNVVNDRTIRSADTSVDAMIKNIVDVLQNKSNSVPNGIVLAFRNQSKMSDEKSIQEIWSDLVDLGLINPNDNGEEK